MMARVTEIRIDDPGGMNVLGLFLARALRRNLEARGGRLPRRGVLAVEAEGMRAAVVFGAREILVTRREVSPRVTLRAPLADLANALARPGLRNLLRVKVRGSRLFALRCLKVLRP